MSSDLIATDRIDYELVDVLLKQDPRIKSKHTKRGYRQDLARFDAWRAGRPISKTLVEQYAAELQSNRQSPDTINRALAALRWYARRIADNAQTAQEAGAMSSDQVDPMVKRAARIATVSDVTGQRGQVGRMITSGELAALVDVCERDNSAAGARDAAMIAVAWSTGARRDELAALRMSDITQNGGDDCDLRILGKGDKIRNGYLYNGAYQALKFWLSIRGDQDGYIFNPIGKTGKIKTSERMSGEALRLILDERINQAGIMPFTWHDFRRTFASNLIDETDLVTVQMLMGHSSPATTAKYDRRGEQVRRKAVQSLFVPFHKR